MLFILDPKPRSHHYHNHREHQPHNQYHYSFVHCLPSFLLISLSLHAACHARRWASKRNRRKRYRSDTPYCHADWRHQPHYPYSGLWEGATEYHEPPQCPETGSTYHYQDYYVAQVDLHHHPPLLIWRASHPLGGSVFWLRDRPLSLTAFLGSPIRLLLFGRRVCGATVGIVAHHIIIRRYYLTATRQVHNLDTRARTAIPQMLNIGIRRHRLQCCDQLSYLHSPSSAVLNVACLLYGTATL